MTNEIMEKCICGNELKITWNEGEEFKAIRCPNCNNEMRFKNPMYVKDAYIPPKLVNNEQTLDDLIKKLSGNDPFWETSLKKYFDSLDKDIDEKVKFLRKVSYTNNLFNEFTKEMINSNNPEDLYNKYVEKYNNTLVCPNCGQKLIFMMPDGKTLHCDKCNKYYTNNNGEVGNETSSPYTRNDVLY